MIVLLWFILAGLVVLVGLIGFALMVVSALLLGISVVKLGKNK